LRGVVAVAVTAVWGTFVALFASIGTWAVAKYAFGRPRQDK
jgi:hypothetical protein